MNKKAMRNPSLKASEREEVLHLQYPFVYPPFEVAVWSVMKEMWGMPKRWLRTHVKHAHKILSVLSSLTPQTLSLAEIKNRIAQFWDKRELNHVLFNFLVKVKSEYQADDADMFHNVINYLAQAGRTYCVLFATDVKSFDDIAYLRWCTHRHFYVIRTDLCLVKSLLRSVMMGTNWGFECSPNQKRIDILASCFDVVGKKCNVYRAKDINVPLFFALMDEANRKFRDGEITSVNRSLLIKDIIHVYRSVIKGGLVEPFGPIRDINTLLNKPAVDFFLNEYISFDKTFVFNRWSSREKMDILITIDIQNVYLRNAYGRFLSSGKELRAGYVMCRSTFVDSLGCHAEHVGSLDYPFSEETLFTQMNYYIERFKGNHHRSEAITFVKQFYLSIDEQTNGSFFRDAQVLTYKLLTSRRFEKYCEEGYSFRRYSPFDRDIEGDRIVFFVSGLDRFRKNYLKDDYLCFDLSSIENDFYRNLAWKAITSTINCLYRKSLYYMLREMLPFLCRLKSTPGYPVPQLDRISVWDSLLIADYYHKKHSVALTYNHNMREVRNFFRWASAAKMMYVDEGVLSCLKGKKLKQLPTNTPVLCDDDITVLTAYFVKMAKRKRLYGQALILMQLCLMTPLRIGQSCALCLDELVYDDKLKSYMVVSSNKATYGSKSELVLGGRVTPLIKKAIKIYQKNSLGCPTDTLLSYLFLCQTNYGTYTVISTKMFDRLMSLACEALGLPKYTARNLRATYMTKAYVEACENGVLNEFLLTLYSYHKRIGTTIENYVNHSEALAALTDHLKRFNDWQKELYPDTIKALEEVLSTYDKLLTEPHDEMLDAQLRNERSVYETKLKSLKS